MSYTSHNTVCAKSLFSRTSRVTDCSKTPNRKRHKDHSVLSNFTRDATPHCPQANMVYLDRVGNDAHCIKLLRETKSDDCSLVLSRFKVSLEVVKAINNLLSRDPYKRTWEVEMIELDCFFCLVCKRLGIALGNKISSLKITGRFPSNLLHPFDFSTVSVTLKKVTIQKEFDNYDTLPLKYWLHRLTSLEELTLIHVTEFPPQRFLFSFLSHYSPTSQIWKLWLEGFKITNDEIRQIREWQNLQYFPLTCVNL